MAELIPVNIVIGDRTYRIKTNPSDEEAIRRTLKTINEKIVEFKTQFSGKDMQDYIAMVLLWFVTEQQSNQSGGDNSQISTQLEALEALLDNNLEP